MKILDVSAGYRNIWFNQAHPMCTFLDIRKHVEPDVIMDSKDLAALPADYYDLAVFDPPHVALGPNSNMADRYGVFSGSEIRIIVQQTAIQLIRVLKSNALLAFKWNDHDQRLWTIIKLLNGFEPLFGHKVAEKAGRRSSTYWILLRNEKQSGPRGNDSGPAGVFSGITGDSGVNRQDPVSPGDSVSGRVRNWVKDIDKAYV
jgi:hypothetical protein